MVSKPDKKANRAKKHYRMRKHLVGTAACPRLAVFRSNKHMYAQIIDDQSGRTLAAASTVEKDMRAKLEKTNDMDAAKAVGELVARRAQDAGITEVVFDRAGFLYHGRVAALADGAREAGLQF